MKMIKKWIACLMAVGMMLSLTACGVSGDQVAVNKPQQKDPDAHAPKRIAADFDRACAILKKVGFRYHAVFRKRKPTFEAI